MWLVHEPVLAVNPPHLSKQSAVQAAAVRRAQASARKHSVSGLQDLASIFNSAEFKLWLAFFDDGSGLQQLQTSTLVRRIEEELSAAELVHSFGVGDGTDGNCGMDVSLRTGIDQPYFYNQWLLQALGLMPVDPAENVFAEGAETHFWGFPPFANLSTPDVPTAADRPVYAALNMYRIAAGNPQCGPVAAVFARSYVGDQAIASPVDTGNYFTSCGKGQASGSLINATIDCTAWKPFHGEGALGVPGSLAHLLPAYARFYTETSVVAGAEFVEFNLARLAVRLLSRRTYDQAAVVASTSLSAKVNRSEGRQQHSPPLLLNFFENTWGYLELNPAVTISQPDGIKMLIGTFDNWFGTHEGMRLREWCISRRWPLSWSHDPIDSTWRCSVNASGGGCKLPPKWTYSHGISPSNARILDPFVLRRVPHGDNITRGEGFREDERTFDMRWRFVNESVPERMPLPERRRALDRQWRILLKGAEDSEQQGADELHLRSSGLAGGPLAIQPLFARSCADEACVGVRVSDGACVCPSADVKG